MVAHSLSLLVDAVVLTLCSLVIGGVLLGILIGVVTTMCISLLGTVAVALTVA